MPKLKTKSSAKKRFRVKRAGSGSCSRFVVIAAQANKQHNMRKRSSRQLRDQRGTQRLIEIEAKRILKYMPYRNKFR